jgi:crotonobetainyl-CoA:carnitine CoA-transferase CaiB-like acyl-CoA transferase
MVRGELLAALAESEANPTVPAKLRLMPMASASAIRVTRNPMTSLPLGPAIAQAPQTDYGTIPFAISPFYHFRKARKRDRRSRFGNTHRRRSPHDVFPCRDGDWVAIAVGNDAESAALSGLLGSEMADPVLDRQRVMRSPWRFSSWGDEVRSAGPILGADNAALFESVEGLPHIDAERAKEVFR